MLDKLTQDDLKRLFHYDQETGLFTRLVNSGTRWKIGQIVGCLDPISGYLTVGVGNKTYRLHRLAFLYVTGKWPEHDVDHIDGIGSNNKWANLREATELQNMQNYKKANKNNKSKFLGVSTQRYGFQAVIYKNRKRIYLGLFKTPELAHTAYLEAKRKIHPYGTL